jgi:hypothetical protein
MVAPWQIARASVLHNPEASGIVKRHFPSRRKNQNGRTITRITIPIIISVGASFHIR